MFYVCHRQSTLVEIYDLFKNRTFLVSGFPDINKKIVFRTWKYEIQSIYIKCLSDRSMYVLRITPYGGTAWNTDIWNPSFSRIKLLCVQKLMTTPSTGPNLKAIFTLSHCVKGGHTPIKLALWCMCLKLVDTQIMSYYSTTLFHNIDSCNLKTATSAADPRTGERRLQVFVL